MNQLLVNADDFGLHHDINRGILDCFAAGAVCSISVCPTGSAPDWDCLKAAQASGVRMGVHLTWVGESWHTRGVLIPDAAALVCRLAVRGRAFVRQVEAEAVAQIERCREHGLHLSHLDSHQHVHLLPGLWPLCVQLARRYGIPRVRVPAAPRWRLVRHSFPGIMLQILSLRRRDPAMPAWPSIGLAHSGRNTLPQIDEELSLCAGSDVELIVHPGITTAEALSRYGAWHYDWSMERDMLVSREFRDRIAARGYRLAVP